MFRNLLSILLLTFILFIPFVPAAGAETPGAPLSYHLQAAGQTEHWVTERVRDDDTRQQYHIFVRLPDDYAGTENKSRHYPALILLDGGLTFGLFAGGYYRYLRLAEEIPPMLVIGIGYGTDDWRKGNARSVDFTLPSTEADHYGGAPAFAEYLTDELLPEISRRYRVDEQRRFLFGQSLGGQFVLYAMMYGDTPFSGGIASNPALHRNLDSFLKPVTNRTGRLFVSQGDKDADVFRVPGQAWREHWQREEAMWPFPVQIVQQANHNHFSITPVSLRDGLIWLFHDAGHARDQ